MTSFAKSLASAALVAVAVLPLDAQAGDPGNYFVSIYDNAGKWDMSFHYWDIQQPDSAKIVWPELGLGYGINEHWYTRVYVSNEGGDVGLTALDSTNWQNDFKLTSGQTPYDLALHTKLTWYAGPGQGQVLEIGPAFQTESGLWRINTNLFFRYSFGAEEVEPTQLSYQWRALYPILPGWHWGVVGMGEVGEWNNWAPLGEQSHRIGPTITSSWSVADGHSMRAEAAYLQGKIEGQTGSMLMVTLRYQY